MIHHFTTGWSKWTCHCQCLVDKQMRIWLTIIILLLPPYCQQQQLHNGYDQNNNYNGWGPLHLGSSSSSQHICQMTQQYCYVLLCTKKNKNDWKNIDANGWHLALFNSSRADMLPWLPQPLQWQLLEPSSWVQFFKNKAMRNKGTLQWKWWKTII